MFSYIYIINTAVARLLCSHVLSTNKLASKLQHRRVNFIANLLSVGRIIFSVVINVLYVVLVSLSKFIIRNSAPLRKLGVQ